MPPVAPLVANGALSPDAGVVLAAVAIETGAFTVARRTLDPSATTRPTCPCWRRSSSRW